MVVSVQLCTHVDFRKAFDTVDRNALYYEMVKLGIEGKILRIINVICNSVERCVRVNVNLSDF